MVISYKREIDSIAFDLYALDKERQLNFLIFEVVILQGSARLDIGLYLMEVYAKNVEEGKIKPNYAYHKFIQTEKFK